jgi:uncharacterized protein
MELKGHDWFHIERYIKNAILIGSEGVTPQQVQLVLCYDIADSKFHDGDETIGPKITEIF